MTHVDRNIEVHQTGYVRSLIFKTRGCGIKSLIGLIVFAAFFMGATASSHATFSITASPSSVCPGDQITVTIVEDCMDPDNEWYYSWLDPDNISDWTCTAYNQEAGTATFVGHYKAQNSDAGNQLTWTYEDYCYGPSSTSPITVVGAWYVDINPECGDNWIGNPITYTVVVKPSGATSPDTITWSGDVQSGATGTSTTQTYTTTGSKQATANVGTSTANATEVIHKLLSVCDADCPSPSAGRITLGIGETASIGVLPKPSLYGFTMASQGQGGSSVTGNGHFTASQSGGENPTVVCEIGYGSGPTTTISYSIQAPTGLTYVGCTSDQISPYDTATQGEKNQIGYGRVFEMQILPYSVSFKNAKIQEVVPTLLHQFPSPAYTLSTVPGSNPAVWADCSIGVNINTDKVWMPMVLIGALLKNGVMTADSFVVPIPYQYKNANGDWVQFANGASNTHTYSWFTTGVTTLSVSPGTVQGQSGGPWQ